MGCCLPCLKKETQTNTNENTPDEIPSNKFFQKSHESALLESGESTILNPNPLQEADLLRDEENDYTKDDFEWISLIGKGAFGKVYLVIDKKDNLPYAIKVLHKKTKKQDQSIKQTKTEKIILRNVHSPLIIKYISSFEDNANIYILTEFIEGGDLFFHLHKNQFFSIEQTQFFIALIVLALDDLHKYKIIYRDLKPENILIDSKGYIKLTDFGSSEILTQKKSRARSGTFEFLSPEALLGKGYNETNDWWSLGVIMYELLSGSLPFKISRDVKIDGNVFNSPLQMYEHFTLETKDLLIKLLEVNPKKRLGYGKKGIDNIKSHPFFNGINWEKLSKREMTAPYIPIINSDNYLLNFDPAFTSEKISLDEINIEKESSEKEVNESSTDSRGS